MDPASGLILDLTDPRLLPQRDRIRPLDAETWSSWERRWSASQPSAGEIVDDLLDGQRVYPEPSRHSRPVHPLSRLPARLTAPVWFFVGLAAIQAYAAIADLNWAVDWTPQAFLSLALGIAFGGAMALLPAGVLIWRKDAWRSAGLVLGGSILWTTLPATAGLIWRVARPSTGLTDRPGSGLAVAIAAVAILTCLGPVLVAFGLERVRRTPAGWLGDFAWRAGLLAVAWTAASVANEVSRAADGSIGSPGELAGTLGLAGSLAAAVKPLELLGLTILGLACATAVLAEEAQPRLWQCGAGAAALLATTTLLDLPAGGILGGPILGVERASWGFAAGAGILATGAGLLLLAFASPVWSAARDAEGRARGAPDEIFAWGASAGVDGSDPIPMSAIVAVAAGSDHALALDVRGRIGAWGDNTLGQIDVPEGLSGVVAVAAGDGFSLALRADGTVAAWGADDLGQTEIPGDLAGVTAIAAGRSYALALRSDGTVVGWGSSTGGVLPVPEGLTGVTAISAGNTHALAKRVDGTVVAWGDDGSGQLGVPLGLNGVTAISAGGDFSVALLDGGTVVAWGDNRFGQLDVPPGLTDVTAVAAGAFHAVALRAGGDVVGWGGGQKPGEADHPWHLVDFKAVAAGDGFSLAIRAA